MSLDLDRGFYPIDLNGKITIREIVETILDIIEDGGGGSGGEITIDKVTGLQTALDAKATVAALTELAARVTALEEPTP